MAFTVNSPPAYPHWKKKEHFLYLREDGLYELHNPESHGKYKDGARISTPERVKTFLERARQELEQALKDGDSITLRDAAEKGWNAVVQATDALLIRKGFPPSPSHRERRQALIELSRRDEKTKALGLKDRYMAREETLYESCFYEGLCFPDLVRRELDMIEDYIKGIESL
jgi:uncharacterized protein (UPF0332 family)